MQRKIVHTKSRDRSVGKRGIAGQIYQTQQLTQEHDHNMTSKTNITIDNYDLKQNEADDQAMSKEHHRSKRSISAKLRNSIDDNDVLNSSKRSRKSRKIGSLTSLNS